MNQEVKAQWIAALRSGRYQQTTGVLKNNSGYCCLGVLCDISPFEFTAVIDTDYPYYRCEGKVAALPNKVIAWAGLSSKNPIVHNTETFAPASLAEMNDGGATFLTIADIIEQEL